MFAAERFRRISRSLGFRLTLSYVLFFTVMLAVLGVMFRQILSSRLESNLRDVLDADWSAMKGYIKIEGGKVDWDYDSKDDDERFSVERLKRIYLVADAKGKVLESSDWYNLIGVESPAEIQQLVRAGSKSQDQGIFRYRWDPETSGQVMLRGGVVFANDRIHEAYFVSIGRTFQQNNQLLRNFTRIYLALMPFMILAGSMLGWSLAGRSLRPVTDVAEAAERISGSNLSLRIPDRGAGDQLDHLIQTFNRMVARLDGSFQQIRQFSTDVSHELRTPITAIRGQLEVALFTAKNSDQYREAIENSLQDIDRLSQIVRALLLLAQSESGQIELQRTPLDLSTVVRDLMDQFQIPAEEGGVTLSVKLPQECRAELDRVQIERLISNLVSNAIKFTPPEGSVHVGVRRDGDLAEIEVADTGCGMEREHLSHIFDRFYRVPNEQSSPERGLGLGLSFVAWIVKAHGGTIHVDSEPGKGSRFVVRLPVGRGVVPESQAAEMGERVG